MTSPQLAAAHRYLEQGLSILPTQPDTKRSVGRWKHWQSESMSHELAEMWWSGQAGQHGIGIITGDVSGDLAVLDVEPEHVSYVRSTIKVPDTATVETARGGLHIYCQGAVRCSKLKLHDRVVGDIRGRGGYVVAPPSVTKSGRYEWNAPLDPTQLAPVPEWTQYRTAREVGAEAFAARPPPRAVRHGVTIQDLVCRLPSRLRLVAEDFRHRESQSEIVFAIVLECVHQGASYEDVELLFQSLPIGVVLVRRSMEKGDNDYLMRTYGAALDEYEREVESAIEVKCHRVIIADALHGMRRRKGAYVEVFRRKSMEMFYMSVPLMLGPPHDGELSGEWLQFLSAFDTDPTWDLRQPQGIARGIMHQGRVIRWIRKVVWK